MHQLRADRAIGDLHAAIRVALVRHELRELRLHIGELGVQPIGDTRLRPPPVQP